MAQSIGGLCIRPSADGSDYIIFIHGILSNSETAWQNKNGAYWPSLLTNEPDIRNAGVYAFGYRTDLFSRTYSLKDVVDSLREFFNLDQLWSAKRLCFVCHSMGGIVARKFTVTEQSKFIQNKTKIGFFLVASPSLGSRDGNLAAPFARLFRNSQAEALRFSQQNVWLNELDSDFITLKENGLIEIVGKELIEDNAIPAKRWALLFRQTVEPFAAARYFGEPVKIPFSDHSTIAKPENEQAEQYRELVFFLRRLYRDAATHDHHVSSSEKAADLQQRSQIVEALDEAQISQINQDLKGSGSQSVRGSGGSKISGVTQSKGN
jgi:hypothetical protein